jgi:hypothetical protein
MGEAGSDPGRPEAAGDGRLGDGIDPLLMHINFIPFDYAHIAVRKAIC